VLGFFCQAHDLSEHDLAHLRDALQPLQSDLEEVRAVLSECAGVRGVRKVLQCTEILNMVRVCDGKLSHALQLFQTKMAIQNHLLHLIQANKVESPSSPDSVGSYTSPMTSKPSAPEIFFGREAELAQIMGTIFSNIESCPAHIAILGPGGYGKTTLANAVLNHGRVVKHFGDARYFVACETASTSGALLIELARALGILEGSDTSWSHVLALLNAKESILCLDNFESPWDQANDIKTSVEELLLRIAEIHCVTLLITMRGTERPARVNWTQPTLALLKALDHYAAKLAWNHIANNYDSFAEKLLKAVDHVPLAVNLLAHLAQAISPSSLWEEWNKKHTELIKTDQFHRLSNLDLSIWPSLNSSRMRSNLSAQNFLGILSVLPDGIHIKQLDRFKKIFNDIDIFSSLKVLQNCSLIYTIGERYKTHPIIYHFCNNQKFLLQRHEVALTDFYLGLASHNIYEIGSNNSEEMVLEFINTKFILTKLLQSNYKAQSILIKAILSFLTFCISIGDYSENLICDAIKFIQQYDTATSLLIMCYQYWGKLLYHIYDIENARLKLEEAEKLCLSDVNTEKILYANVIMDLGNILMHILKLRHYMKRPYNFMKLIIMI